MTRIAQSTRQAVNRTSITLIEIPYEDDLVHRLDEDGAIIHDPNYPDPDCPCHSEEDEQGDTTSELAAAMASYRSDFYSVAPVGNNAGGTWLERQIGARIFYGVSGRGVA